MSTSPAGRVVGNIQNSPTTFTVQKKTIPPMLLAITGGQINQFAPPVRGLADCQSTGKFARKVGQNRRALQQAMDAIAVERKAITAAHEGNAEAESAATLALFDEPITITCPGFTTEDFEGLKDITSRIVDWLMDLEVGGETNVNEPDAAE